MRKKLFLVLAAQASVTVMLVAPPIASAGDTVCADATITGPHDNVVVPAGTFCELDGAQVTGNVKCDGCDYVRSVNGTTIGGNLEIKRATGTSIIDETTIGGNLDYVGSTVLDLENSSVGGSVKLEKNSGELEIEENTIAGNLDVRKNSFGAFDEIQILETEVLGDVKVEKNRESVPGRFIEIDESTVHGNLQVENNLATGDPPNGLSGFEITLNAVGENLQFSTNTGASDISGNTITQSLQCRHNSPPPTGGGNTAGNKEGQCSGL